MSEKVLYLAGPGDTVGSFGYWLKQEDDPRRLVVTYSHQFFAYCKKSNSSGYSLSSCEKRNKNNSKNIIVENLPINYFVKRGVAYHIANIIWVLKCYYRVCLFKPSYIIGSTDYWFLFLPLSFFKIKLCPLFLNKIYGKKNESKFKKIINRLNFLFFNFFTYKMFCLSEGIKKQLLQVAPSKKGKIFIFLPFYRKNQFEKVEANIIKEKIIIIYPGRIEENKGVFDIVDSAKNLINKDFYNFKFIICGGGSDSEKMKELVDGFNLGDYFEFKGHLKKDQLVKQISRSNVFVAPTTIDFLEGMNQTGIEAALCNRPIIITEVCPVVDYLGNGSYKIAPSNPEEIARAILKLYQERDFFEEKKEACKNICEKFQDNNNSLAFSLLENLN